MTLQILCSGIVPATGLGDALQYLVGALLTHKNIPNSEITLSMPNIEHTKHIVAPALTIKEAKKIKLVPGLYEQVSLISLLKSMNNKNGPQISSLRLGRRGTLLPIDLPVPLAMLIYYGARPSLCRLLEGLRYDACLIGGHTIEAGAFTTYITTYNCARTITKGPLITFPISASCMGLREKAKLLRILKMSLNRLDMIFVRGKHSYNILAKIIKDDYRLDTALDSGFAIKLLYPSLSKSSQKTHKLVTGVIPRKDYFYTYNRIRLYVQYLKLLKCLIEDLTKKFDAEVLLIPHSLKSVEKAIDLSDESAVDDLVDILSDHVKEHVKVTKPLNVLDSLKIINSCDILITSRMHAGIIALAYGKPAMFFMPKEDIKVLDVLSTLGLDEKLYIVDSFNPREYGKLISITSDMVQNLSRETKVVEYAVNRHLPEAEKPVILMRKLLA